MPAARDEAAIARAFGRAQAVSATPAAPPDVQLGNVTEFWVLDRSGGGFVRVAAALRYAGPVLLMYVDTQVALDQDALERSAREFEQNIYQRNRTLFGAEASPGVDGDPRITVLNTQLNGVGGYFSPSDAVIGGANRFSNGREMFVMGVNAFPLGTPAYAATLAHEFQHMIAWNVQRRRPAWLDEGLSALAEDLNGYVSQSTATSYLADPDLQLTGWDASARHYGMSRLFMRYFHEHYTGDAGLAELAALDAGNDLEAFARIAARRRPDVTSFAELFGDWAVANLLGDPSVGDGRFAYALLPARVTPRPPEPGDVTATVQQFGADYIGPVVGPATIALDGADSVSLVGVAPASGGYAWWSNRGDESVSTLTRALDLSAVSRATLEFALWHAIETHFDYAFVTVSSDGGTTWQTLPGRTTTTDDPQGQSLGDAFTGLSGAPEAALGDAPRGVWVTEQMDLSPYAGRQIVLRFWLMSDAAINGPGMLLDDIRVPEIGFADGAEAGDEGWQAQGFVRTSGVLPQEWEVRLVRYQPAGPRVEQVALDEQGRAQLLVAADEQAVLVVSGATPYTSEAAAYTYQVISRLPGG
jgi:immune inhibitor A